MQASNPNNLKGQKVNQEIWMLIRQQRFTPSSNNLICSNKKRRSMVAAVHLVHQEEETLQPDLNLKLILMKRDLRLARIVT